MKQGDVEFTHLLATGGARLGLTLDEPALSRLESYNNELKRWMKKINLIARSATEREIVENHFLDSLALLPLLQSTGQAHLLDVGTGAGFPGLVCKAAWPELTVTLVEPRLKRVSFLRHVIRTLQLEGVEVIGGRIEDEQLLASDQQFSHITSRAVTDICAFSHMVYRFLRPGVQLVCMKGPNWRQEMADPSVYPDFLSLEHPEIHHYNLPFSSAERTLLVFRMDE